jgi:hypothetical protein
MRALVEYMKQHGNEIHRHPGGFWAHKGWSQWTTGGNWFGSSSVQALVTRKVAEYTEWQEGKRRFPVAAKLVESGS